MKTLLVLGSGGILGTALGTTLPRAAVASVGLPKGSCDIRDGQAVSRALEEHRPDVVVNAAAYTRVDDCEDDRETAFLVNGVAPGLLARRCREAGIFFVHVSTDFVFDGNLGKPYSEADVPRPLSAYGASKLLGETEVAREGGIDGDWLTVRTSWHYGAGGANFVETIHGKALEGAPLRVVADQRGRPTYSGNLAQAIVALLEAGARGLFHYADAGEVSWFELTKEILARAGIRAKSLDPIRSSDLVRKAQRPAYSVLATEKYERATGRRPPPFVVGLDAYLATLPRPAAAGTSHP